MAWPPLAPAWWFSALFPDTFELKKRRPLRTIVQQPGMDVVTNYVLKPRRQIAAAAQEQQEKSCSTYAFLGF